MAFPVVPEVASTHDDYLLFKDGARVSWQTINMLCTCVTAKAQRKDRNCCKHTVFAVRNKRDYVIRSHYGWIPLQLASSEDGIPQVSWVGIQIDGSGILWATLNEINPTCIGPVGDPICRWDARNLIVPHILGLAWQVRCKKCPDEIPHAISAMLANREQQVYKVQSIREVAHWLELHNDLCIKHDDSDLVPF